MMMTVIPFNKGTHYQLSFPRRREFTTTRHSCEGKKAPMFE